PKLLGSSATSRSSTKRERSRLLMAGLRFGDEHTTGWSPEAPANLARRPGYSASPGRLEAVSPQSKECDESRRHCCEHCATRNDERGCGPELRFANLLKRQPGALAHFVQLSSSSFDPLQLQIVEVVLD